eukprot:Tamp_08414.p1 GENE.Tamp_08414~~Tamp_08414.p1  ORF type:complete len:620 (+),score=85.41 Tamp_08414:66-1925(+)
MLACTHACMYVRTYLSYTPVSLLDACSARGSSGAVKNEPAWSWSQNGMFNTQDAVVLHCIIRHFRPSTVIEIGAGHSTRVGVAAALINSLEGHGGKYVIVEPFPARVPKKMPGAYTLLEMFVEKVSMEQFLSLARNDVLFIDSSHLIGLHLDQVTKKKMVWQDVAMEFTELIPRLAAGVIIHVHDIPFPLPLWYKERGYTEQFILQALLQYNRYLEPIWIGGAASRPFWQREAGDGKVSEAASVERGSVMLELEHVLGTNYRAPDAKKMQTNFGGGGSMWFRRTSLEYPGGPLAGLPHSCSSRLDCKASLQDVFSARSTWFGLRTEVDPQLLSIRERAGQRVGTDGEWVQWTCAAWQRFKGRAILLVSPRKQGEALQCSARPGMKEPVVRQRAASSLKLREVLALEENDIVVYRLLPGAAACLSENDSAVIFVTEILPRLKPGVLVIIMGISYPHHSNFVSGVKETDAAQFLFQAALAHNDLYTVIAIKNNAMVARRNMHPPPLGAGGHHAPMPSPSGNPAPAIVPHAPTMPPPPPTPSPPTRSPPATPPPLSSRPLLPSPSSLPSLPVSVLGLPSSRALISTRNAAAAPPAAATAANATALTNPSPSSSVSIRLGSER